MTIRNRRRQEDTHSVAATLLPLVVLFGAMSAHADETAGATYQYRCICTSTTSHQAYGKRDCNFKSFYLERFIRKLKTGELK